MNEASSGVESLSIPSVTSSSTPSEVLISLHTSGSMTTGCTHCQETSTDTNQIPSCCTKRDDNNSLAKSLDSSLPSVLTNSASTDKGSTAEEAVNVLMSMREKRTTIVIPPVSCNHKCKCKCKKMNGKCCCKRYRGIYERSGRWNAQIQFEGKKKHLGTFKTRIEAALRYDEVAKKLYGSNAKLNFQTGLIPKKLLSSDSTHSEEKGDAEDERDLANILLSLKKGGNALPVKSEPSPSGNSSPNSSCCPRMRSGTRPKCCVMRDIMQSHSKQPPPTPFLPITIPQTVFPSIPISTSTLPSTVYPFFCMYPDQSMHVCFLLPEDYFDLNRKWMPPKPANLMSTTLPAPFQSAATPPPPVNPSSLPPPPVNPSLPKPSPMASPLPFSSAVNSSSVPSATPSSTSIPHSSIPSPSTPSTSLPSNPTHSSMGPPPVNSPLTNPQDDKANSNRRGEPSRSNKATDKKQGRLSTRRPNHSKYAKTLLLKWLTTPSHFFNPYPGPETKQELARETNLREEQIANWFVNTRKRFLTPIISDLQIKYGTQMLETIINKSDLYNILKELVCERVCRCYTPWLTSFLSDPCYCWLDYCYVC